MGGTVDPNASNPFNKIAGPAGWLIGALTGVIFIGMLYNGATHHDDDHGADHAEDAGGDHAEEAGGGDH
jgi:hypothetical protein